MQRRARLMVPLLPVTVLAACGFGEMLPIGPLQEFHRLVEAEGAKTAEIELDFGIGTCEIVGAGDGVMEASAVYNVAVWEPTFSITESGDHVAVVMKQGKSNGGTSGKHRNEWSIGLGRGLPLALDLDLGLGRTTAAFAGVSLSSLNADAGMGEFLLDLDGVVGERIRLDVDCGMGRFELRVPSLSTVSAKVKQGMGAVDADDFTKTDGKYHYDGGGGPEIEVSIRSGMGKVDLVVAG